MNVHEQDFATENMQPTWLPSRFNLWTRCPDKTLLVYNSLSGAFLQFRGDDADTVADIIQQKLSVREPKGVLALLVEQGLLVLSTSDELERARRLHESRFLQKRHLHLILMPTEQCNFRCVYCYEDFSRGRMSRNVIESVVKLVATRAPDLESLSISWFGGEPLAAFDIVEEISDRIIAICASTDVAYTAGITTNGYLLNHERAGRCLQAGIKTYQVTLDGNEETHNRQRLLAGGGETFRQIVQNLRLLRARPDSFCTRVRVNFAPGGVGQIPLFLQSLASEFGHDQRFHLSFHAVGHWGGEQDHLIQICDQRSGQNNEIEFMTLAGQAGFGLDAWKEAMQPFGSACYAADPNSFCIGSDGTVYKCTVAFKDPRNQVGKLSQDGNLNIREDLHRLWTSSGEETDVGCQQCSFRPACQGNHCPLERLVRGDKTCPSIKERISEFLPVLANEAVSPCRN